MCYRKKTPPAKETAGVRRNDGTKKKVSEDFRKVDFNAELRCTVRSGFIL